MIHTLRRVAAGSLALSALLAAIPAAAGAAASAGASARSGPLPFFDAREGAIDRSAASSATPARALPAADRAARKSLVGRLGRQAVLDADPITATPRTFGRLDGALTGPRAGDAETIALGYVRGNAAALGLSASDLSAMRLADRTTVDGITHLRWRQEFRGVPAFDNELRVNVDGDGRVVNVLGAPRHALSVASVAPRLSAAAALAALARNVGSSRRPSVTSGPSGARADTRFTSGDRARLVLFGDVGTVRLAWHLTLHAAPNAVYDAVVDAGTGRVLRRANMVKGIDARVFRNYPGALAGGAQVTVSLDPFLTPGNTTTLSGPFAHAWSDINDSSPSPTAEAPDPGEDVVPDAYVFNDFTGRVGAAGACDNAHRCSWDHRVARSWDANRAQNAVQAFYYVNHYAQHLSAPPIDFTPAGGGFAGDDPVSVETDDGANLVAGLPDDNHRDNANMFTPPDGQSPTMQMYLFFNGQFSDGSDSPFRDVNGGDDASVVYHEYTHGLSNRLVTDADGAGALNSAQAGAMGEAWSDWYAKDFLNDEGFQPDTAADGEVDMGAYVDATPHQIRTQPLDCPVDSTSPACPGTPTAGAGGYTYGDFGHVADGPEVHSDGEIWGETLWDLRGAIASTPAEEIVTEAMRLSPPEPSFLDMRNAILQADIARRGGADVDAIWQVFARRGMGFFAGTVDGADTAPVENFDTPPPAGGPTGRISGRVTDSVTGAPLGGITVGVGGLDTPPSSFVATTAADGTYSIGPVPAGTYPIVVFHPGTGYEQFLGRTVAVAGGGTTAINAAMRRDWAAESGGAALAATNDDVFAPFGCGADGAFDLSQGSGWSAYNAETAGAPGLDPSPHQGAPPTATVRLPAPVNVTGFGVDPSNTCGDDPSAATQDLRIEVSTDGATFTPAITHTFGAADLARINTLPVATIAGVRFVRITMLTNQSNSAAGGAGEFFTDLSEFEVFGAPTPAAGGAAPGGAAPAPAAPQPAPGSGTAPTQAVARPVALIRSSRVRGRATFTVGCSVACRATATMTVSRATARRLHLSRRTVARATRRLTAPTRRTFALNVSRATLRRLRARGVRTLSTTVTVSIRDARGQTRTVRRAVRVRIR
jgi:extracellular elastinolytic metalloproteinase